MTTSYDDEVTETVQAVWATLFEFPLTHSVETSAAADREVTALVQLDGAWQGAVMLQCSATLAAVLTAAMFNTGDDPAAEDIRDALGEVANMVAGNIKAVLPQPSSLGLPVVAFGRDYEVRIMGAEAVTKVGFSCRSGPLLVSLMQRSNPEEPER